MCLRLVLRDELIFGWFSGARGAVLVECSDSTATVENLHSSYDVRVGLLGIVIVT